MPRWREVYVATPTATTASTMTIRRPLIAFWWTGGYSGFPKGPVLLVIDWSSRSSRRRQSQHRQHSERLEQCAASAGGSDGGRSAWYRRALRSGKPALAVP